MNIELEQNPFVPSVTDLLRELDSGGMLLKNQVIKWGNALEKSHYTAGRTLPACLSSL
jgi:hypothetical protein